ncbi:MAG: hypothetical protein K2X48_14425 [Chitinophagaceae bacterium]|nr:hypothetical protein [Chitinophagaceae bacterium]
MLIQEVSYNKRYTVDEEYSLILTIKIIDPEKLKSPGFADAGKDTSIIKCVFDFSSVWDWGEEDTVMCGTVSLVSAMKRSIKLKFDLTVNNLRKNRTYVYRGIRNFKNQE